MEQQPLGLQAALAIVEDAEQSTRRQLNGNTALIYLLWGLAWIAGYGALEGSRRGWLPLDPDSALIVLAAALLVATVTTVVLSMRSALGIRGHSAFQGGMHGASWAMGFLIMGILSMSIGRAVDDFWLRGMLINSTAVLIVGLLYVAAAPPSTTAAVLPRAVAAGGHRRRAAFRAGSFPGRLSLPGRRGHAGRIPGRVSCTRTAESGGLPCLSWIRSFMPKRG